MTESDVFESTNLNRCIRELEDKLAYWKRQRETAERLIEKITERMAIVLDRQKQLLQSRAAGAS